MSAVEETNTSGTAGKDTTDGGQPSAAASTRADTAAPAVYPHLEYGDAVHAELVEWELYPPAMDVVLRTAVPGGRRELLLRLVWPAGYGDLAESVRADGLTVEWSHLTGWAARTAGRERLLDADLFAAPAVVAEAALHLVEDGLGHGWAPEDPVRWEHAGRLAEDCAVWEGTC